MAVHEAHLVDESFGHAHEHVINVRADRSDAGQLLSVRKPQVNTNALGADAAKVHVDVVEVAGEDTAGTLDGDDASVDVDLDCES